MWLPLLLPWFKGNRPRMKPTLRWVSRKTEITFPRVGASHSPKCTEYRSSGLPVHMSQHISFIWNPFDWVWRYHSQTTLADCTSAVIHLPPWSHSLSCSELPGGADTSQGPPCPLDPHWVWLMGGTCWRSEAGGETVSGVFFFICSSSLLRFRQWLLLTAGTAPTEYRPSGGQPLSAKVTFPGPFQAGEGSSLLPMLGSRSLEVPVGPSTLPTQSLKSRCSILLGS